MKKSFYILIFLFSFSQAHEFKAIFDCSSSNPKYIASRMMLIEKTINMIEKDNEKAKFVLTLHGGCVPMVSKTYEDTTTDEDLPYISKAQETITKLSKEKGVKIIACAMSLEANAIEKEDVLPFVAISKNSFLETIKYQNLGYALMPLN